MDESEQFAEDILGSQPDVNLDDTLDESLTNESEEMESEDYGNQEESQTSEEQSDAYQDETETTESNLNPNNSDKRSYRMVNRIQSQSQKIRELLARQEELKAFRNEELGETLTQEQLDERIERKAESIIEAREIERLQEEYEQLWTEDLESLIQTNPELNPDSKEYNKQLDDYLTSLITDSEGNLKQDVPVSQIYSQLQGLLKESHKMRIQQNKKVLSGQLDESALSNSTQGDYQSSKKSFADLDPTNPAEFLDMIEKGLV
jgi:hypothetical protein